MNDEELEKLALGYVKMIRRNFNDFINNISDKIKEEEFEQFVYTLSAMLADSFLTNLLAAMPKKEREEYFESFKKAVYQSADHLVKQMEEHKKH